ncbi:MAG: hypothetical protein R3C62_15725 [Chloroflexota bacterium]
MAIRQLLVLACRWLRGGKNGRFPPQQAHLFLSETPRLDVLRGNNIA